MTITLSKPEKSVDESSKLEEGKFNTKPSFYSFAQTLKPNTKVVVMCRNHRQYLGNVIAVDHHFNIVLENVTEMWKEVPKIGAGNKGESVDKERFLLKTFLRGGSVVMITVGDLK